MLATRIKELEQQLAAANQALLRLTQSNAEMMSALADAELLNKKLKRSSPAPDVCAKDQLGMAQRHGRR